MSKRKRKRSDQEQTPTSPSKRIAYSPNVTASTNGAVQNSVVKKSIQIITGSYDKVLHGIIATISFDPTLGGASSREAKFSDNFLFNAHNSAIRCLALSPTSRDGRGPERLILASGGTDERINLYHISSSLPDDGTKEPVVSTILAADSNLQNPKNKELGSLLHHASNVNVLHFTSRSKLLSAADDNTVAICRTRDWTVLSTIKAPVPKVAGRPSGDTAPPGGAPSGMNDFAVHPSQKLMISVGKGEKCMRLWNLVTGKKAGVLNFERELLQALGESRWARGEGRKVTWNAAGTQFAVAFEKGAVLFGMNSEPIGIIAPRPLTKLHQMQYIQCNASDENAVELLAISTEDGRILFYSCDTNYPQTQDMEPPPTASHSPYCRCIASLGGNERAVGVRIKDFACLDVGVNMKIIVTAGSDGVVRIWLVQDTELIHPTRPDNVHTSNSNNAINSTGMDDGNSESQKNETFESAHVGSLLGVYETSNRITCMKAILLRQSDDSFHNQHDEEEEKEEEEDFVGFDSLDV